MKKVLCLFVCACLLFSVCAAETFVDMPNNWATEALNNAVSNGLIGGSDGYIRPNDPLTRAEMATIMVRAFGGEEMADLSGFADVSASDWFYPAMSKAVAMGAFTGDGSYLNPQNNISRQETFAVLARMFSLDYDARINKELGREINADAVLAQFSDGGEVASWAKELVAAVVSSGYVGGSDGKLSPKDNITRAEFAAVMNRLVTTYVDKSGTYTSFPEGNVVIRTSGVVLDGATISGDLIVGEGAKDGAVLSNTNVSGRYAVRAGKENILTGGTFGTIRLIRPGVVLSAAGFTADYYFYAKDTQLIFSVN